MTCKELSDEMKRISQEILTATKEGQPKSIIDRLQVEFDADHRDYLAQGCDPAIPAPPFVVSWEQADDVSIQTDEGQDAWNAGHVNDVLEIPTGSNAGALLVGSDTGGIWLVQQPNSTIRPMARPLSDHWGLGAVDMTCLEAGPDGPDHFYAGTFGPGGRVLESNPSAPFPLDNWRNISTQAIGTVYRIAVLGDTRRIVIACDAGVRWSSIPSPGGSYVWQEIDKSPPGTCKGLAVSENDTVLTAFPLKGIFRISWTRAGATARFTPFPVDPTSFGGVEAFMGRTSLTSCRDDLKRAFAVIADPISGYLARVYRSEDAGATWTLCNMIVATDGNTKSTMPSNLRSMSDRAGKNGNEWNNCIAVSPSNPDVVAIGWNSGPIISDSGGRNAWVMPAQGLNESGQFDRSPHLHSDIHGVRFDPSGQRLYVGSDGGVASTNDLGGTFFSRYNRELLNLQFYSNPKGSFGASTNVSGLVAGGTQDNGNLYTVIGPGTMPWRSIDGGDGGRNIFAGATLLRYFNGEPHIRAATWSAMNQQLSDGAGSHCAYKDGDGVYRTPAGVVPLVKPRPSASPDDCGLPGALMATILNPLFHDGQRTMVAIAALNNHVYGLFSRFAFSEPELQWDYLGSTDSNSGNISALASVDGHSVFAGTTSGSIFKLAAPLFPATRLTVTLPALTSGASIDRLVIESDFMAFAMYNAKPLGGFVRFGGQEWVTPLNTGLPGGTLTAMEMDWTSVPPTLFLCTSTSVVISEDRGDSWHPASKGLPEIPNCSDLRFVRDDYEGSHYLYLATYGRSLWRARLNRTRRHS